MWTKAQSRAFGLQLVALGEVFNEPVSAARLELFLRLVEDLPYDALRQAVVSHGRTATFFPKPAELRQIVLGQIEDQAELAWTALLREVRRVGWLGTPRWPDVATEAAALGLFGGSWRALCEHLPAGGPELLGFRKQFVALYGATARQARAAALPPSRDEAKAALADLKTELQARGLKTGKL